MKSLFLTILCVVAVNVTISIASVILVDNRSNSSSISFSVFSDALAAAENGDTLMLYPSVTSYGNLTINKQVVVLGTGFNPVSHNKITARINLIRLNDGADNVTISGVYIDDDIFISTSTSVESLSGITIENCFVGGSISLQDADTDISSFRIEGNILGSNINTASRSTVNFSNRTLSTNAVLIAHNIIYGNTSTISIGAISINSAVIENNIFISATGDENHIAFMELSDCLINNNIFYRTSPSASTTTFSNNSFSNNIAFESFYDFEDTNVIPGTSGTNVVVLTNQSNIDPLFVNLAPSDDWTNDNDPSLQSGSPALAADPNIGLFSSSEDNTFLITGNKLPFLTEKNVDFHVYSDLELVVDIAVNSPFDFNIVEGEYYFDQNDSGIGQGQKLNLSAEPPFVFMGGVSVDALDPGIHSINIRFLDANGVYGITEAFTFYLDKNTSSEPEITSAEIFLNADPGYGEGTEIIVSPSSQLTTQAVLTTDAIGIGFQSFYVRTLSNNNEWSIPEQKLVFIDEIGDTERIQQMEYFIDADPGFGNGTLIDLTSVVDSSSFLLADVSISEELSVGFHNLFIRAELGDGVWGMIESRLVYVDESSEISLIENLEYFFDSDPGFGSGEFLDLSAITDSSMFSIAQEVSTSGLSVGFHTLYLRAQLVGGSYGIPESKSVYIDQSGQVTEIDQLEYFFDEDPGYGVGKAIDIGSIDDRSQFSVSEMVDFSGLNAGFHQLFVRAKRQGGHWGLLENRTVYIDPQGVSSFLISELEIFFDTDPGYGNGLSVSINEPLERINFDTALTYLDVPQTVGDHVVYTRARTTAGSWGIIDSANFEMLPDTDPPVVDVNSVIIANTSPMITGTVDDVNATIEVSLNGQDYTASNLMDGSWVLPENTISPELTEGIYDLRIKSQDVTGNMLDSLFREVINIDLSVPVIAIDSIESNVMSPALSGKIDEPGAVIEIAINNTTYNADNNGDGTWSVDEGKIENLTEGVFSVTVKATDVANNMSEQTFDGVITIDLTAPTLEIDDVTTIVGLSFMMSGTTDDTAATITIGENTIADISSDGSWMATLSPIETAGDQSIEVQIMDDAGNSQLQNFTITVLEEPTLAMDSATLVKIFQETNGNNWSNNTNWLVDGTPVSSWFGVTVVNDRVTEVDLSENNLSGAFPVLGIAEFTGLIRLDLSNNGLTSTPDFSNLLNLSVLDLTRNKLQFEDLLPNIDIETFSFSDQDSVVNRSDKRISINEQAVFEVTTSEVSTYQWFFNGSQLQEETSQQLSINVIASRKGEYSCRLTNASLPGLTIVYKAGSLSPLGSISGQISSQNDLMPIEDANLFLLAINNELRGYDTISTTKSNTGGDYSFEGVPTGDYLISVLADTAIFMGTYFGDTIAFAGANVITVNDHLTGFDVVTQRKPILTEKGDNVIRGQLIEDFDEPNARALARRNVRLAGVSLYRSKGRNTRTTTLDPEQWELVAYTQTDDEGRFSFVDLPDAIYRIQIEFPGVPIDETTDIEFNLTDPSTEQQEISLEAVIENGKIGVKQAKLTGIKIEYFKNLKLHPIPLRDYLFISYEKLFRTDVTAVLIDSKGKALESLVLKRGGKSRYRMVLSGYESGLYFLQLRTGEKTIETIKIIRE